MLLLLPPSDSTAALLQKRGQELSQLAGGLRGFLKQTKGEVPIDWNTKVYFFAFEAEMSGAEAVLYFIGNSVEWVSIYQNFRKLFPNHSSQDSFSSYGSEFRKLRSDLIEIEALTELLGKRISEDLNAEYVLSNDNEESNGIIDHLLWLDEIQGVTALDIGDTDISALLNKNASLFLDYRIKSEKEIKNKLGHLSNEQSKEIKKVLTHYRHTRLQYSFLQPTQRPSYLLQVTTPTNSNKMTEIYRDTKNETASEVIRETVNPFLRRLGEITEGRSFKDIIGDFIDGGISNLFGGNSINLIPSETDGVCTPLLVAFSSGRKFLRGRLGGPRNHRVMLPDFPDALKAINKHLAMCGPGGNISGLATQVVLLICDEWSARYFEEEYYELFSIYHAKGVEFIFMIEGSAEGGAGLSEIKIGF